MQGIGTRGYSLAEQAQDGWNASSTEQEVFREAVWKLDPPPTGDFLSLRSLSSPFRRKGFYWEKIHGTGAPWFCFVYLSTERSQAHLD